MGKKYGGMFFSVLNKPLMHVYEKGGNYIMRAYSYNLAVVHFSQLKLGLVMKKLYAVL